MADYIEREKPMKDFGGDSMKKYELTESYGTFWRIRALRYIPRYGVRPGDLGGWIESEENLSQDGDC